MHLNNCTYLHIFYRKPLVNFIKVYARAWSTLIADVHVKFLKLSLFTCSGKKRPVALSNYRETCVPNWYYCYQFYFQSSLVPLQDRFAIVQNVAQKVPKSDYSFNCSNPTKRSVSKSYLYCTLKYYRTLLSNGTIIHVAVFGLFFLGKEGSKRKWSIKRNNDFMLHIESGTCISWQMSQINMLFLFELNDLNPLAICSARRTLSTWLLWTSSLLF